MGGQFLNRTIQKLYIYEQHIFDLYLGVTTSGVSYTEVDKFHADTENFPYLGCQWPALSFVLRRFKHSGTFVDLGSGKGKALLIAGLFPYRRVVGVEIDDELSMEARRNIERLRRKPRAGILECVTASVVDWKIPDDTSLVFMSNPFFGETFRQAMGNVFASYDRNPREMHVVYMFPWEHEWLLSTGRVEVESVKPEGWPQLPNWWSSEHVTVVYHVIEENRSVRQCHSRPRRRSKDEQQALQRWSRHSEHSFSIEPL